jgi:Bacterial regulatory proteins, luxR family
MSTIQTTVPDLDALRAACPGGVVTPEDENWDAERMAFNITFDQRPVAVALPSTADEVAAVVDYARTRDLRVVPHTNRDIAQTLFVTPKTVEVHLSATYRKLGIRSRRDLAKSFTAAAAA